MSHSSEKERDTKVSGMKQSEISENLTKEFSGVCLNLFKSWIFQFKRRKTRNALHKTIPQRASNWKPFWKQQKIYCRNILLISINSLELFRTFFSFCVAEHLFFSYYVRDASTVFLSGAYLCYICQEGNPHHHFFRFGVQHVESLEQRIP